MAPKGVKGGLKQQFSSLALDAPLKLAQFLRVLD
jgi:hypothetical protein